MPRFPGGRSYSGIHRGAGKLLYFGGGHGSYAGNDVELYDLATNLWEQQYQPEDWVVRMTFLARVALENTTSPFRWEGKPNPGFTPIDGLLPPPLKFVWHAGAERMWIWDTVTFRVAVCPADVLALSKIGGGSTSGLMSPLGRPYTLHTYQMFTWDPGRKVFLAVLQGYGTLAYDLVTKAWTPLAGPYSPDKRKAPEGRDVHTWGFLQPGAGELPTLVVTSGDDRGVWRLGTDDRWKLSGGNPSNQYDYVYSCYVDSWRAHLVYCWRRWWRLDARTAIWTVLDGPAPGVVDSFDYDSANDVVVGVDHGKEGEPDPGPVLCWVMSCSTGAWSQVTPSGPVPPKTGGSPGLGPMLAYDPERKRFVYLQVDDLQMGSTVPTKTWQLVATSVMPPVETIHMGPARQLRTFAEVRSSGVKPGSLIELDNIAGHVYDDSAVIDVEDVTVRGQVSGTAPVAIKPVTTRLAGPDQGILVVTAKGVVIDNLDLSGATGPSESGVRLAAPGLTTIRGCRISDCDDGILGGGVKGQDRILGSALAVPIPDRMGQLLVEDTTIEHCGTEGEGQSHNIYVSARLSVATFRNVHSRGVDTGHLAKARAEQTIIERGRYEDTRTASLIWDFPEGGDVLIDGAQAQKGEHAENSYVIGFGEEVVPANHTNLAAPRLRPIVHRLVIRNTKIENRQTVNSNGAGLEGMGLLINFGPFGFFTPAMLTMDHVTLLWPANRVEGLRRDLVAYTAAGATITGVTVAVLG
jgi:hypothetical protein